MGVTRWNRLIEKAGHSFRLSLPSTRFRRNIGIWAGVPTDTTGKPITQEEFNAKQGGWLPSESDRAISQPDAGRARAGQDGRVDCASRSRHQQQSSGLRVREAAVGVALMSSDRPRIHIVGTHHAYEYMARRQGYISLIRSLMYTTKLVVEEVSVNIPRHERFFARGRSRTSSAYPGVASI